RWQKYSSRAFRPTCSATTACTPSPRHGVIRDLRFFHLARLRGEVGFYAKRKIRGILHKTGDAESPPLPASGAREHTAPAQAAFACTVPQNSASRSASRSVAGLASGEATSPTSVLAIGPTPSIPASTR